MNNVIHVDFGQKLPSDLSDCTNGPHELPPPSFYDSPDQAQADREYLKGFLLDESRDTWLAAERHYRKALKLDPNHTDAMVNLGNLWYRQGNLRKASALWRQALRIDPDHLEANFNYAYACHDQKKDDLAINHYLHIVELDPTNIDAHFNLALIYSELGEQRKAWPHRQKYELLKRNLLGSV